MTYVVVSSDVSGRCCATVTCQLQRVAEEWRKLALKACDDKVRAYWACRQEQGMLVVINCRPHLRDMNSCVAEASNRTEEYDAFRTAKLAEYQAERLQREIKASASSKIA